MQTSTKKQSYKPWGDEHPEKFSDDSSKTIGWNQQLKGLINPSNMLDQLFGAGQNEKSYSPERTIPPSSHPEKILFSRKQTESEAKLVQETQVILTELKKQVTVLEAKSKGLVREASKIKVEQLPPKAGIYYLRYLEWLMIVVRQLRVKIEDGSTWLATFAQMKKKKMGYWQRYKKHGTTFGLSHERGLATQTG